MTEPDFSTIQQWMQSVITTRGALDQKLASAVDAYGIGLDDLIVSTPRLGAMQRLDIYASGYVLRLVECLQADFPALRRWLGPTVFDMFAKAYLVTKPPASYTLFDLSRDFPRFLADTRPANSSSVDSRLLDLPIELCRLERARIEAARAAGLEGSPVERGWPVSVDLLQDQIKLSCPPCLRLLELKFPLLEFIAELDHGRLPDPPALRATYVAVSRVQYRVYMTEIEQWQLVFLETAGEGKPPVAAAHQAAACTGKPVSEILAGLVIWLPNAFERGWLTDALMIGSR